MPLFTVFGVRVRAHASLVVTVILVLLFGLGQGFTVQDRVISMTMLFAIILLHEFGHVFMARRVGGDANDILMTPIGGLAFASPPRRALPTFLTAAAGPAVNVVICLVCGVLTWLTRGFVPLNPFNMFGTREHVLLPGWAELGYYALWTYAISYGLLLFNLWPIFPLDGGRMLQAALWPKFGYFKSMRFACVTGMIGAVVMAMVGLTNMPGGLMLVFIALSGFMYCYQQLQVLKEVGPHGLEEDDGIDYSAAYEIDPSVRKRKAGRLRRWLSSRQAVRERHDERSEQERIDQILAKVSATGMQSLSWFEKRALRQATENQRQRELQRRRR
jgi:Zn-dependent protease